MVQGKAEIRKRSQEACGKSMEIVLAAEPAAEKGTIWRKMQTDAWLSVLLPRSVGRNSSQKSFTVLSP